jgi:hypothetical protein
MTDNGPHFEVEDGCLALRSVPDRVVHLFGAGSPDQVQLGLDLDGHSHHHFVVALIASGLLVRAVRVHSDFDEAARGVQIRSSGHLEAERGSLIGGQWISNIADKHVRLPVLPCALVGGRANNGLL